MTSRRGEETRSLHSSENEKRSRTEDDTSDRHGITPTLLRRQETRVDEHMHTGIFGEKDLDGIPDEGIRRNVPVRHIPRKYQIMAFAMIIFFNTSSSYSESTLSPLKSIIRKEMNITSECDIVCED
jgi:hypothetical protein